MGPGNRWAYVHVDEMVPTVAVPRGDGPLLELRERRGLDDRRGRFDEYVDGLAVLHEGALVLEAYRNEMRPDTLHLSQSVGKSVLGLLVGILRIDPAIARGTEYVPEVAGSGYTGATVQHLLDMTAAIDFVEDYATILALRHRVRMAPAAPGRAARRSSSTSRRSGPRRLGHGERLHYSTPNTDLLGLVAERAGGAPLAELIARELWAPLGAERDAVLTVDTGRDGRDRRRLLRDAARLRAARRAGAARRRRARARTPGSRGSASATRARSSAAASRPRARAATGSSGGGRGPPDGPRHPRPADRGRPRRRRRGDDPVVLARRRRPGARGRTARARRRACASASG